MKKREFPITIDQKLFIEKHEAAFKEPIRKGTPKGQKIGFSRKKFLACLWSAIAPCRIKQLAEQLDISYGSLRVWRSQDDFKRNLRKYSIEYAQRNVTGQEVYGGNHERMGMPEVR